MSNPQSTSVATSWAYWPSSDKYMLTPKWEEFHADSDATVRPTDEPNRLELVGNWWSDDVFFTLALRDTTDTNDPKIPEEEPTIRTRMWLEEGWAKITTLSVVLVQEEGEWNGDVKIDVTSDVRTWLGHGNIADFTIDAQFPSSTEEIRIAYGTLLLRR